MLVSKITNIEQSWELPDPPALCKNVGLVLQDITKEQIKRMLDKYDIVIIRKKLKKLKT
ncbi:MAG: hypothetical protein ACTSUK_01745 [Promethearchaeota archaeon]